MPKTNTALEDWENEQSDLFFQMNTGQHLQAFARPWAEKFKEAENPVKKGAAEEEMKWNPHLCFSNTAQANALKKTNVWP